MDTISKWTIRCLREDVEKLEPSYDASEKVRWCSHCGKQSGISSENYMYQFLCIYPREIKNYLHAKTCTQKFMAALFIIAKKWKKTQMSINWWMNFKNVVYSYIEILLSHKEEWSTDTCYNMKKPWRLYANWRSQAQKVTFFMIPFLWNVQNRQIHRAPM